MNRILEPYIDKFVVVYLDDILIFSRTAEEHQKHLCLVLDKLREAQLFAKRSKCQLAVPAVEFLDLASARQAYMLSLTGRARCWTGQNQAPCGRFAAFLASATSTGALYHILRGLPRR